MDPAQESIAVIGIGCRLSTTGSSTGSSDSGDSLESNVGSNLSDITQSDELVTNEPAIGQCSGVSDLSFLSRPDSCLHEPNLFNPDDAEEAMICSRGPRKPCSWPATIVHRFDDIASDLQRKIAVRWVDGEPATYADLARHSGSIATAMQSLGISLGSRVAVLQEPTPGWIASILAIMRIGAVYIPLDLENPWARLATITTDCQPHLVLVDDKTRQHISKLECPQLAHLDVTTIQCKSSRTLPIAATPDGAAAILYTSGSSGTPKGIVLKHEGLCNWFATCSETFDLGDEHVLQQSSSGFDMSMIQIFTAICHGGCLHLLPRRFRGDAQAITKTIHTEGITFTFTCTSELSSWFKYGNPAFLSDSSWRRAFIGGEPGVEGLFDAFSALHKSDLRLFHAYGPTETSFTATTLELSYHVPIGTLPYYPTASVGYPLPNYQVYVLDTHKNIVPLGVQGEVYIGGPGVSAGYWRNDTLTNQRFVKNPFATPDDIRNGWDTLHRTGDLGRWGQDGTLFLEGRISGDTQVKLRGLRIDLREIEGAIIKASKGAICEAVVSVRRNTRCEPEYLAAHIVYDPSWNLDRGPQFLSELKRQLQLPRYMCPAIVVPLEQIPLTNSGKLDRQTIATLPLPEIMYEGGRELTETESSLKTLWTEVLPLGNVIDPETDFFQVGGTSLLFLSLQARVRETFAVQLQLFDMFESSTLSSMAYMIESHDVSSRPTAKIDWGKETEGHPTSTSLRRSDTRGITTHDDSKTVVLTGSTGLLGSALLEALVLNPLVGEIHCIAVRRASTRGSTVGMPKVKIHDGDLLLPRLGLSEADADRIFDSADLVIHNGADVSYMKSYASLRSANLQSTKELVKLSAARKIPFHYISSGSACTFASMADQEKIGPVSVLKYPPPTESPPGYAASKWACEVFLENTHSRHEDWFINIHRPSNIERRSNPDLDIVQNLRYYSQLTRSVPMTTPGLLRGSINCVTLDKVVKGVLTAVYEAFGAVEDRKEQEKLQFFHHTGDIELPLDNLVAWILMDEENNGTPGHGDSDIKDIEMVSFHEWASRAGEQGMDERVVAFMQSFDDNNSRMEFLWQVPPTYWV